MNSHGGEKKRKQKVVLHARRANSEGVARFEVGQSRDGSRHGLSVGLGDVVESQDSLVMPEGLSQYSCFPSLEAR